MAVLVIDKDMITLSTAQNNPLLRSVIISLFSWRRAHDDDEVDGDRFGFWGDTYNDDPAQLTGSRLWELLREKVTDQSVIMAKEYCEEALQWLIDDSVCSAIDVTVERSDLGQIDFLIVLHQPSARNTEIRFQNVWSYMK